MSKGGLTLDITRNNFKAIFWLLSELDVYEVFFLAIEGGNEALIQFFQNNNLIDVNMALAFASQSEKDVVYDYLVDKMGAKPEDALLIAIEMGFGDQCEFLHENEDVVYEAYGIAVHNSLKNSSNSLFGLMSELPNFPGDEL